MNIKKAEIGDLPEILALQKLAYQSEAILVNDFSIPPLTQTLESITNDFHSGIILKAVLSDGSGKIIGSVRSRFSEGTLYIGRLMVNPSYQNQGVGARLLSAIETLYPEARFELFTSNKSEKNLSFYIKNGYREFRREPLNEQTYFIFLEKLKV